MIQKMKDKIYDLRIQTIMMRKILLVVRWWDRCLSLESSNDIDSISTIQDATIGLLESGVGQ